MSRGTSIPVWIVTAAAAAALHVGLAGQTPIRHRLNPVIDLLEQKKAVFGVYNPSNPNGRGRAGAPPPAPVTPKSQGELAKEALAYGPADFLFNGSMEGGLERALPAYAEFVKATADAGALTRTPFPRFAHPLIVKTPKIAPDTSKAVENISRELNLGVSGIMFVETESADEVRAGLAAMRFASKGGTRPEAVGGAPAYWGMSDAEYPEESGSVAAQPGRRTGQLDDRREPRGTGARAGNRRGEGHRSIMAWCGHASRRVHHDQRNRRTGVRRRRMGERDSAGAGRMQGIQRALRLSLDPRGHRDAHETGLLGVRDELGRAWFQSGRSGPRGGRASLNDFSERTSCRNGTGIEHGFRRNGSARCCGGNSSPR